MKKVASLIGAGALLLGMAGSAFACTGWWCPSSDDVTIHNWAVVDTDAVSFADSGDNFLGGMCVFGGSISTGKALAQSIILNDINTSIVGCTDCGDVDIFNGAFVDSWTFAKADSGDNFLGGMMIGGSAKITAGAAEAGSLVDNVVNFSVVGVDVTEN